MDITTDFQDEFSTLEGEIWDQAGTDASGIFGTDGDSNFGSDGDGLFAESVTAYSDRRYHTPGVGRSFSVKIINDTSDDFQINSATFALTARTD